MPGRWKLSLLHVGSALALVLVLAGCTKGGQFDPTEWLNSDVFDSKKKLEGSREPLFPNGVPGAASGVPQDLVKGYQPPPEQDTGSTTADQADNGTAAKSATQTTAPVETKPAPIPNGPAEALDRISVPPEVMAKIAAALTSGGSIVVSDQGIAQGETGEYTDFIVRLR